jgi:predicted dithiol-disulfide oxidoreductase (DUF899 family)
LALFYSRGFNRQAEAGCGGFPNAHLRVDSTGRSMRIHKAGHTYPQISRTPIPNLTRSFRTLVWQWLSDHPKK